MNIKRTNKYGASIIRCEKHMNSDVIKNNFIGGPFIDTPTDKSCIDCDRIKFKEDQPQKMEEFLLSGKCVHTRYRRGAIFAYRADITSPSSVMLECTLDEGRFNRLFHELSRAGKINSSLAPLSPVENLMTGLR